MQCGGCSHNFPGNAANFTSQVPYSNNGLQCPPALHNGPVQTVEQVVCHRTERIPVQRAVHFQVPVQKAIRIQVPFQRAVHGMKQVVSHITVNRPKMEVYTKMVPVQATRIVSVPSIERQVHNVPSVNYVTEVQDRINYVTEMQQKVNHVTDFVTRHVPVIKKRIRTRYETVQDLPGQDAPGYSYNSADYNGSYGSGYSQYASMGNNYATLNSLGLNNPSLLAC